MASWPVSRQAIMAREPSVSTMAVARSMAAHATRRNRRRFGVRRGSAGLRDRLGGLAAEGHRGGVDRAEADLAPGDALLDQRGGAHDHGGGDLDGLKDDP